MKAKLLKKIRKRFQITHHPKGITEHGEKYEFNLFILKDDTNQFYNRATQCGFDHSKERQYCEANRIFKTEKECIDHLKSLIVSRLRSEGFRGNRDRIMKNTARKVWYLK
jgi:hypothetical protein